MSEAGVRHIYGPVPSRRLGRSLGVDLVPFKTCTYDCVYCQLGRTTNKTSERREYVAVDDVMHELGNHLAAGTAADYITLAGSGEPTLHARIGDLIARIKQLTSIPVAVITNGSLLWMREVQESLMAADLVLPSLDVGDERLFRQVNRPLREISFERMLHGIAKFTGRFRGAVWLEVFLIGGISGTRSEVARIAAAAKRIRPKRIQLTTVSRPPAEAHASAVREELLESFATVFTPAADVIAGCGHRGVQPADRMETEGVLALLARRPCTLQDIAEGIGAHPSEVAKRLELLTASGRVSEILVNGQRFFRVAREQELSAP
jgi:wyosine [tRNA(Phe)-imidazoG37] synthetase (radical SAM superfamily)